MVLCLLDTTNLPLLSIFSQTFERVTSFKLLGLQLDSSPCWPTHINHIIKKATTRLCFLKELKRTGLSNSHLFHFYSAPQRSHCTRYTSYSNSVRPAVCLSICLSVTRRHCVKTTARSTIKFALSDSKMCLVL